MKRKLYDLRQILIRKLIKINFLYLFIKRNSKKTRNVTVNKNTDIVIEGYPRSANTFSVVAFELAQNRDYNIGHHIHKAPQVLEAVKKSIPAILLIRRPKDAILSLIIKDPSLSIKQALYNYIDFYKKVLPHNKGYVIASFENVVNDFGSVIKKVNHKFHTEFMLFDHTKENLDQCFNQIGEIHKKHYGNANIIESSVARPSEQKKQLKNELENELHKYSEKLAIANELYNQFKNIEMMEDKR